MAADELWIPFRGMNVHIKVIEPEGALLRRVFVLSSPVISTFNWRKILPEMNQAGALTVVMDLPGFGQSACGPGAPQDNRTRASLAWGVIDEIDAGLGEEGAWHLMGHGSACQVLMDMANLHPDSVSSQIYICPLLAESWLHMGGLTHAGWYRRNIESPAGFRAFVERLAARPLDEYVVDAMRQPYLRRGAEESFLRMLASRGRPQPLRGFAPVMALMGEKDPLQDRRETDKMRELIPEAEIHTLKTAGHLPMETHSHALRDYIRGWMNYVG